ncbi:MAG: ABC transporter ATP-binding protein [Planctomycetes bacterium]|nr:ABC transporter ATP-binding protein [Planctomycetota bacterium]
MQTLAETAVRLKHVEKSYGLGEARVPALRGVDLDVGVGELLMLVGPSGCGKTTLISVVAGILDQDAGSCEVFGREINRMRSGEKTRFRGRTVGFVFQQFNLLPALTARENVAIPLLLGRVAYAEAQDRAQTMLERVGLGSRSKALPSQLSGGQQQRVAIARALVHEPRLVVCDEPTSSLDQQTGQQIVELLREVALSGSRALIVVTHDSRIFRFADRIAVMNDGLITRVVRSADELEHPAPPRKDEP